MLISKDDVVVFSEKNYFLLLPLWLNQLVTVSRHHCVFGGA